MTEKRAPASPLDIFNVCFGSMYDPTMHIFFRFNGAIDEERMRKAVMLALDANPYLSSRYVEAGEKAFWERIPEERWNESFEIVTLKEGERAPPHVPPCSIDIFKEASFRVKIYSNEDPAAMITFSLHHGCADAKGLMDATSLVISIYKNLFSEPGFKPEKTGWYDRDPKKILEHFSEVEIKEALAEENRIIERWAFPYEYHGRGRPGIANRFFPEERLNRIRNFCHEKNATVNDLLIAANIMAMLEIRDNPSDRDSIRGIMTSADMRRHLEFIQGQSIENLSVSYMVEICTTGAEDFEKVLDSVAAFTGEKKAGHLGLGNIVFYDEIYKKGLSEIHNFFREIHSGDDTSSLKNPVFANLGVIDERDFDPGVGRNGSPLSISDAIFIPITCWPPGFLLTAMTWRGSLQLSCGFEEGPYSAGKIEEFLDLMDKFLP